MRKAQPAMHTTAWKKVLGLIGYNRVGVRYGGHGANVPAPFIAYTVARGKHVSVAASARHVDALVFTNCYVLARWPSSGVRP